uniref:Uncharacterized protein n=1 Tax=Cacopsylla melanoneura TaxID=428564 RepID=A0A8D8TFY8_9HEMI
MALAVGIEPTPIHAQIEYKTSALDQSTIEVYSIDLLLFELRSFYPLYFREYTCPLCRQLANSVLPLPPHLGETASLIPSKEADMSAIINSLSKLLIENIEENIRRERERERQGEEGSIFVFHNLSCKKL